MNLWRRKQATPLPLSGRMVVVDVETTGLDVARDELLSIGAVPVAGLRLDLPRAFERTLRRDGPVRGVLIHGLAPSRLREGTEPELALREFLAHVGECPLFAFHANFDRRVLERALARRLGLRRRLPFLDLAELMPAFFPERQPPRNDLDGWLAAFQLEVAERHDALADALATAELLLILLQRARAEGVTDLAELARRAAVCRKLRAMRSV